MRGRVEVDLQLVVALLLQVQHCHCAGIDGVGGQVRDEVTYRPQVVGAHRAWLPRVPRDGTRWCVRRRRVDEEHRSSLRPPRRRGGACHPRWPAPGCCSQRSRWCCSVHQLVEADPDALEAAQMLNVDKLRSLRRAAAARGARRSARCWCSTNPATRSIPGSR